MILTIGVAKASEDRTLVLVSSVNANIRSLSYKEVRRLYLGAPVLNEGQPIKPLRNLQEPFLEEVFLQKVIFLSARGYDNHLLSRVFRMGGLRPEAFENKTSLFTALHEYSHAVTYMWEDEVEKNNELKKIGALWTGHID